MFCRNFRGVIFTAPVAAQNSADIPIDLKWGLLETHDRCKLAMAHCQMEAATYLAEVLCLECSECFAEIFEGSSSQRRLPRKRLPISVEWICRLSLRCVVSHPIASNNVKFAWNFRHDLRWSNLKIYIISIICLPHEINKLLKHDVKCSWCIFYCHELKLWARAARAVVKKYSIVLTYLLHKIKYSWKYDLMCSWSIFDAMSWNYEHEQL